MCICLLYGYLIQFAGLDSYRKTDQQSHFTKISVLLLWFSNREGADII